MSDTPLVLSAEAREEVAGRLVALRDALSELAQAYEDPVAKKGADEMRRSLERVLELLRHSEEGHIESPACPTTR